MRVPVSYLQHVSIAVKELKRAKEFYEKLGFKEIERPPFDFGGAWYGIGDQQLHLIQYDESLTRRGEAAIDSRDGHFALRVKDYDETIAALEEAGVEYDARSKTVTGWGQIYCQDPDGNIIEFNAPHSRG